MMTVSLLLRSKNRMTCILTRILGGKPNYPKDLEGRKMSEIRTVSFVGIFGEPRNKTA
jgi:hypothetical protein